MQGGNHFVDQTNTFSSASELSISLEATNPMINKSAWATNCEPAARL